MSAPDFDQGLEAYLCREWGKPSKQTRTRLNWSGGNGYDWRSYDRTKKLWYDSGAQAGGHGLLAFIRHLEGLPKLEELRGKDFIETWERGYRRGAIKEPPPAMMSPDELNGGGKKDKSKDLPIRRRHSYTDENGTLLYWTIRFDTDDKLERFRQWRPGGKGGVIKNITGVRRVLYNLPALIEATKAKQPILLTEGERDADTAVTLGYRATTVTGGAHKWQAKYDYDRVVTGADLILIGDNDAKGREHIDALRKRLAPIVGRLRVVFPPTGKDLTEWIEAGGTKAALDALTAAAADAPASAGLEDEIALAFGAQHADDHRYIAKTGHWMHWTGTRWQQEDTLAAFDVSRTLCRQAGDAKAKTVAAVVALARTDRRIAAVIEQWDPNPDLLNCGSTVVDLKTSEERPPRRDDYCTKQTMVAPAPPGTPCDLFNKFVDKITNKDDELIGFLQRYLGYCLTGHTREHVFVFCYGTGANGKSTFLKTIASILADYCVTSPIEMFLASKYDRHPTEQARLHKIRLTVAHETPKGRSWDESKIKNLTGGDKLTARYMRTNFFDFEPTHKLLLAGNNKPALREVDEAMRRRFLIVPFTARIPEKERDFELTEKLLAEAPQILRWMIDGCLQWRQSGLGIPDTVRMASDEYFDAQDTLQQWLDECVKDDPMAFTPSRALFKSWERWCGERNTEAGAEKAFVDAMSKRYEQKRMEYGRGFKGISLIEGGVSQTEADLRGA
jgi:putative DNA primase/helicase